MESFESGTNLEDSGRLGPGWRTISLHLFYRLCSFFNHFSNLEVNKLDVGLMICLVDDDLAPAN